MRGSEVGDPIREIDGKKVGSPVGRKVGLPEGEAERDSSVSFVPEMTLGISSESGIVQLLIMGTR